jgi:hypothetical protein
MPQDIEPLVQATLSDLEADECDLLWVFDGIAAPVPELRTRTTENRPFG